MKTLDRSQWRTLSTDPWRLRCPDGHTRLRLNSGAPTEKALGWHPEPTKVVYDTTGDEYRGQVNCRTCERSYYYAVDVKDDEKVVLEPDTRFVTEQADY